MSDTNNRMWNRGLVQVDEEEEVAGVIDPGGVGAEEVLIQNSTFTLIDWIRDPDPSYSFPLGLKFRGEILP